MCLGWRPLLLSARQNFISDSDNKILQSVYERAPNLFGLGGRFNGKSGPVHNVVNWYQNLSADGPRFRIKPYSVQADLGSTVTLMCDVDGNPPPNIVWIHEDSGRVIIVFYST